MPLHHALDDWPNPGAVVPLEQGQHEVAPHDDGRPDGHSERSAEPGQQEEGKDRERTAEVDGLRNPGGTFEGDRLRGKVLAGGDDWAIKRVDGVIELDLRVTLETDDGALVHMTFEGIRDDAAPGAPYFRTLPRFEAPEGKYAFLNKMLAVGVGEIRADGPVHLIEEIL